MTSVIICSVVRLALSRFRVARFESESASLDRKAIGVGGIGRVCSFTTSRKTNTNARSIYRYRRLQQYNTRKESKTHSRPTHTKKTHNKRETTQKTPR